MKTWIPDGSREACVGHYGNMRQLCGLKRYLLTDGKAAGVEAVDVDTGGGLTFTVLPGRGMDVCAARYRGVPVAYFSKAGVTAPAYHDPREMQWLKSFFGGMVTTCGLTNAGPCCRDVMPVLGDTPFGLHGDISNTAADNLCVREEWVGDRYAMTVSGRVEEGRLHGEHLSMRRTIKTALGEKCFALEDHFENLGDTAQPLMFFYHINIGHPVLDEGARYLSPSRSVVPGNDAARAALGSFDRFDAPSAEAPEQQFLHQMFSGEAGDTVVALVNDSLEMGVYLRYNVRELPCIAEWKVGRRGEYVLAFEPGNCYPVGRDVQKKNGALEMLEPMASRSARLQIGILDGSEEIEAMRREISALSKQ